MLGFVRVWLIGVPEPALVPVIPPVMVPIFQEKELAAEAVKAKDWATPLQTLEVTALVTAGLGFTVTVTVKELPKQPAALTGTTV